MTKRSWTSVIVAVMLLVAALAYLRDPPWLVRVTSGVGHWQTDSDGTRYRWTTGHASFFVPSSTEVVTLRLRAPKDDPRDWPITATISIDDRPADVVKVDEEEWSTVRLRLPPPGERSLRRIDIKVDRVRSGNRGVQVAIEGGFSLSALHWRELTLVSLARRHEGTGTHGEKRARYRITVAARPTNL